MSHRLQQRLSHLVLQKDARYYRLLRDAMWLYLALVIHADDEGKVQRSFEELSRLTGIQEPTLRSWTGHLRKLGLIRIEQSEGSESVSFHVHGLEVEQRPRESEQVEARRAEGHNGHASEGDSTRQSTSPQNKTLIAIAEYVRYGLGDEEAELEHYIELLDGIPKEVIHRAFDQARKVPKEKIKKSRGALFTYLIRSYAQKKKPGS